MSAAVSSEELIGAGRDFGPKPLLYFHLQNMQDRTLTKILISYSSETF